MKKIILSGLVAGGLLFIISYVGLYLAIKWFPSLFTDYNNPLFNSDGSRDLLFYMHAFLVSMALAWFWDRFKTVLSSNFVLRGIEFGFIYAMIAVVPVMWITITNVAKGQDSYLG